MVVGYPNADALNAYLFEMVVNLERAELDLWKRGLSPTLAMIRERVAQPHEAEVTFVGFCESAVMNSKRQAGTKKSLMGTLRCLARYREGCSWGDLTYSFVRDFELYLLKEWYAAGTVVKHLRNLRTLINEAVVSGHFPYEDNPFRTFRMSHQKSVHRFLLPEELERLERLETSGMPEMSGRREMPGMPETSGMPEAPARLKTSGMPEMSGRLEMSGRPEAPGRLETSGRLETPARPEMSGRLEMLEMSGRPEMSGRLEMSGMSGRLEMPETSGRLDTSGMPEMSGRLETSERPEMSGRLAHVKDAFLFCCYTGLRFSDFCLMRSGFFSREGDCLWLRMKQKKTGTEVMIPVGLLFEGKGEKILKKYGSVEAFSRIPSNSKVNAALKVLQELAGIKTRMTFHLARHTCATLLCHQGVPITTIQRILGHTSVATTQLYQDVMPDTILKDLTR